MAFDQGAEEKNIIGLNLNQYYLNLIPEGKVPYLIVDTKKWADARTFLLDQGFDPATQLCTADTSGSEDQRFESIKRCLDRFSQGFFTKKFYIFF